ncbi:HYR domain-containing protein [Galbibacter mesophilus]|uniref:HYR domain-containing protein n=1 Tax=Galbibacter mesophilus TaxID=379069 RepID=UPI00191D858E|nr:HYR domain-containing protein [Galbibacter mesophilus]MCM5663217.1 HYR domain-containing protein [Galbibacter mesophilus]
MKISLPFYNAKKGFLKSALFGLMLFLVSLGSFAQTAETEPNDDCSTAKVIGGYGTFTGAFESGTDIDFWVITPSSTGDITITVDYPDPAMFGNMRIQFLDGNDPCSPSNSFKNTDLWGFDGPSASTTIQVSSQSEVGKGSPNNAVRLRFTNQDDFGPTYPLDYTITLSGSATIDPGTSPAPPASPGGVSGADLWLKADAGVIPSTGNLATWTDQTSNHTTSIAGNPQVTSQRANFNPTIVFDGVNDRISIPYASSLNTPSFTLSTVVSANQLTNSANIINSLDLTSPTIAGYALEINAAEWFFFTANGSTLTEISGGFVNPNEWKLFTSKYDGSSLRFYVDGALVGTESTSMALNAQRSFKIAHTETATSNPISLLPGEIAEISFYGNSLASNDQTKLESYLALKYGITLDQNVGNYVNSVGAVLWNNSTYWNDVFGIGRDDVSSLNQNQSNSNNTGSADGTGQSGLGNIVFGNPSSLGDGDFLITGHDNGALTEQSNEVPASLAGSQRIEREWLVRHTGDVGTVDLTFDINGLTVTGTTASEIKLLIDADGDFSAGATVVDATALTGGVVSFDAVTLPDGNYFTFVTDLPVSNNSLFASSNLWLKADDGVSPASGTLTGWTDQSGTNTFTVSGDPQTGIDSINFNNAISFDGSGDYLAGDTSIKFQNVYAVIKRDAGGNLTVLSAATGGSNRGYVIKNDNMSTGNNDGNNYFQSADTLGTTQARLANIEIVENAPATGQKSFIDGQEFATSSILGSGNYSNFEDLPFVGRSQDPSEPDYFNGKIAELIMYPAIHSDLERNKIESYLAIKYGISLNPSTTNYIDSNSTVIWNNATYWNDVFGIGQDDGSSLNQRSSNSINTGSGDGTGQSGKGNIVLSNPSSLEDGDFLMLGHDNGALTEQATEVPASLAGAQRIGREWLVRHTGDVGTVDLTVDMNGLTVTGTTAFEIKLLIDADGDFSAGATVVDADNFSNNVVTFSGVTLPDANYITIITKLPLFLSSNLWLKADAGTTNSGANLSGWVDQTGTNTFTVTGTPGYQTNAINFNPFVSFDNQEGITQLPGDRLNGDTEINFVSGFAVYKKGVDEYGTIVGGVNPGADFGKAIFGGRSTNTYVANGNNAAYNAFTNPTSFSQSNIVYFDVSLTTHPFASAAVNRLDQTVRTAGIAFNSFSFTPMIGGTNNAGNANGWPQFQGDVAEVILYPSSLSSQDKLRVETYLALKYGITIKNAAGNSIYLNSSGGVIYVSSSFTNDIFGIGKDDTSGLEQTQSNSINTGSGDGTGQTGKGNIVISNPSSLDDGDFLITGHDNGALTEQATEVPASLAGAQRIGREWHVRHTRDVGTVDLTFDINGLTVTGNNVFEFKLLIDDADGDFTSGATVVDATSFSNNIVAFNGVTLPNNSHFTIVTKLPLVLTSNLWLKADAGVSSSGTSLNNWTDQTGTNTFTKFGTINYEQEQINFNPTVRFNNTNAITATPSNRLEGNTSIEYVDGFAVYKHTNANSNFIGSVNSVNNYSSAIFASAGSNTSWVGNGSNLTYSHFSAPGLDNQFNLVNIDVSLSASPFATGRLNGVAQSLIPGNGGDYGSIVFTPMIGGGDNNLDTNGWGHMRGDVAEVILFPISLSASDKNKVESYFAIKYGIHKAGDYIDFNGTVVWNATANATYHQDVFGIGKDDTIGLNQTQSNSINTGSGDGTGQTGSGNLVLRNPDDLDDGEFMLIGHNNAPLNEKPNEIPGNLAGVLRLEREWFIKHTGDVGAVEMSFDLNDIDVTGSTADDFRLILDSDGDGDVTTGQPIIYQADNYTGEIITFKGIDIPSNSERAMILVTEAPSPGGVTNEVLWLEGNAGVGNTGNGTNVTAWADQTAINLFTVTGAPTYIDSAINFNGAVSFNNTNDPDVLPTNYIEGSTEITGESAFVVMSSNSNTSTLLGSSVAGTNFGPAWFGYDGNNNLSASTGTTNEIKSFNNPNPNNYTLVYMNIGESPGTYTLNGLEGNLTLNTTDFNSIALTPIIGGTNNNGNINGFHPFDGEVAEIIVYPSTLPPADRLEVESYLAIKYGITLDPSVSNYIDSDGNVLWNNTTYWNDVFGIGQDISSGLLQNTSNSINTGSGDGTGQNGLGNIVISNPSALDNLDFLLIGNDAAALTPQITTTDLPSTLTDACAQRIPREWKVQHTNDIGTIDLTFDISGITVGGTAANQFKMIIDTDGDGDLSNANIIDASSLTAQTVSFNNVTLANDAVFTFVTNLDTEAPIVITQDITVQLDASGNVSITPDQVDDNSTDCNIANRTLDINTFDCSNIGDNTVTLTVTDASGNSATATATVTVADSLLPTATAQDITVQLDASGNVSITPDQVDNGSTDNCNIVNRTLDISTFDCSNIGDNTVTLTVSDASGNTATTTATVAVEDNVLPTATAQDITVQLDASGNVSITPDQVDNGSTDNCSVTNRTLDIDTFDCSNIGANTVTLTVADASGNTVTATATVTVVDSVLPTATTQDITVQLDASGNVSITPDQVDNGSTDNCSVANRTLDIDTFDCSNIGANTVTLSVTDANGNTSTATATVTVEDNVPPTVTTQDITVQLDASGNVSITPDQVDNGSTDNCSVANRTLDIATFDCSNIGANTVTLSVTDANGNTATATATVTVEDNVPPTVTAQDITVQLDASGNVSITPDQVDNGSTDNCSVANRTLDIDTFDCSNIGANTVTLSVTDANGNTATATATVTVEDNVPPTVTAQNITVQLDASGNVSITPDQVDNGSTDNCSVANRTLDIATFDCSNIGANTVTLSVTDANGNTATATATVTVEDNVPPTVTAQDITVQLDASGNVSITPDQVDNGSTDNCSVANRTLDIDTFDCSNIGANTVTLSVTDANGNTATATATVTVEDNVPPTVTAQNITVQLDASGNVSITPDQVDNGSTDNCGVTNRTLDIDTFDCSNIGANTVTLSVTDASGNTSTATATVTVEENGSPIINCIGNQSRNADNGNCFYTVVGSEFDPTLLSDNCTVSSVINNFNGLNTLNGAQIPNGTNITWTITDSSGNTSSCSFTITVNDVEAPSPDVNTLPDITGNIGIPLSVTPPTATDNCAGSITATTTDPLIYNTAGTYTITWVYNDGSGNATTQTQDAIIEIEDEPEPVDVITIGNQNYIDPQEDLFYLIDCNNNVQSVDVSIVTEQNATVSPNDNFTIDTPRPGIYTQEVIITSQDQSNSKTYTITIEKRFEFSDIVIQKFDNVLLINNNSGTNGGYDFVSYEWYKNGQLVGTEQYYSAGQNVNDILDTSAEYYAVMTTRSGEILRTCDIDIDLKYSHNISLFPNPTLKGRTFTVKVDVPDEDLKNMKIGIYTLSGELVKEVKSTTRDTKITVPFQLSSATYLVRVNTPKFSKTLKLIVYQK